MADPAGNDLNGASCQLLLNDLAAVTTRAITGYDPRAPAAMARPSRTRHCFPTVGWAQRFGLRSLWVNTFIAMEPQSRSCLFCGNSVRDDEQLIVIEHDGERVTSLAREPELRHRARVLLAHARCAPTAHLREQGQASVSG